MESKLWIMGSDVPTLDKCAFVPKRVYVTAYFKGIVLPAALYAS